MEQIQTGQPVPRDRPPINPAFEAQMQQQVAEIIQRWTEQSPPEPK